MNVAEIRTRVRDRSEGELMVRALVAGGWAACGHVGGPVASSYIWQDALVQAEEWEVDVVTSFSGIDRCVEQLVGLHTYETPAVLVSTFGTTHAYSSWVESAVRSSL